MRSLDLAASFLVAVTSQTNQLEFIFFFFFFCLLNIQSSFKVAIQIWCRCQYQRMSSQLKLNRIRRRFQKSIEVSLIFLAMIRCRICRLNSGSTKKQQQQQKKQKKNGESGERSHDEAVQRRQHAATAGIVPFPGHRSLRR